MAAFLALAALQQTETLPDPTPGAEQAAQLPAEARVRALLEDLREAELLLDADAMAPFLAHSFAFIDNEGRVAGRFAYLESVRRGRERGDTVRELNFDRLQVEVFGASAVASYHFRKRSREEGAARLREGWCTDVFELRDDGAWILVHRHRSR